MCVYVHVCVCMYMYVCVCMRMCVYVKVHTAYIHIWRWREMGDGVLACAVWQTTEETTCIQLYWATTTDSSHPHLLPFPRL